ncbi:Uncharacterised protein [Mycobacteroides abscessus subsp. abscessus]|nr:Uncharacterised protein [Mycobacteroides abscessus subsp. abscessus]
MPNTSRNMPSPLSTTPGMSNLCSWVGRAGTSHTASAKASTPTGTLTMKIHSQLRPSTSTPPRIGPTRVARPATPPQSPIAAPRLSGGKVRVITAIVCGVISAAPRPCTARAAISISMLFDMPHHSEAAVNTARPAR